MVKRPTMPRRRRSGRAPGTKAQPLASSADATHWARPSHSGWPRATARRLGRRAGKVLPRFVMPGSRAPCDGPRAQSRGVPTPQGGAWTADSVLKLKAGPRTIRSRARPNSVLAATLNREADAEIARILRSQEGRWEPKRPALVPRERPGGISPGETTTTSFPQGAAAVIQGSLRTTQRAP